MDAAATLSPREAFAPRPAEGRARGIALSLLVHVGLVVAIAFGVSWRSRTPEAQEAELWAAVPQAAAARAVDPDPAPPVADPPRPAPPVVAPPPPKVVEVPDAKIAIEKARKEQQARTEEQQKAAELERKRAAEAEREAAEKRRRQQEAEQQKKQEQAAELRAAQQREAERQKNLQRIQGLAGASGDASATGTAPQSAGPSASYAGRIKARIRPNIVFADEVAGDPSAEVEVRAAPDGTILGRKLVKSSGVAAYDNAVLRAIDKTETLPRDIDGRVPPSLLLVFRVRD